MTEVGEKGITVSQVLISRMKLGTNIMYLSWVGVNGQESPWPGQFTPELTCKVSAATFLDISHWQWMLIGFLWMMCSLLLTLMLPDMSLVCSICCIVNWTSTRPQLKFTFRSSHWPIRSPVYESSDFGHQQYRIRQANWPYRVFASWNHYWTRAVWPTHQ